MTTTKSKRFKYSWEPPILRIGQMCQYLNHLGRLKWGVCRYIETKYDKFGKAWHLYAIQGIGLSRWAWIGQEDVVKPMEMVKDD